MPYTPVHVLVTLPLARRGALPSLPQDVRRWAHEVLEGVTANLARDGNTMAEATTV